MPNLFKYFSGHNKKFKRSYMNSCLGDLVNLFGRKDENSAILDNKGSRGFMGPN